MTATHAQTTAPHTATQTRTGIYTQHRRVEDNALVTRATRLEEVARAHLYETHAPEVDGTEVRLLNIGRSEQTPGPIRLALRELAREMKHGPALAAYREADGLYWSLVVRWDPLLQRFAEKAARRSGQAVKYLLGVYREGAFHAAIRFDTERCTSFSTYMGQWVRSAGGKDVETTSLVHASYGRAWHQRMCGMVSLDAPLSSGGGSGSDGAGQSESASLTVAGAMADEHQDPLERLILARDREWIAALDAHLPHEQRVVMLTLLNDGNLVDAGARLGVSRERARQLFVDLRANVPARRDDACANFGRVPCRWPKCRRRATGAHTGLCVEHLGRAELSGVAGVFLGRVPSVAEVEQAAGLSALNLDDAR